MDSAYFFYNETFNVSFILSVFSLVKPVKFQTIDEIFRRLSVDGRTS